MTDAVHTRFPLLRSFRGKTAGRGDFLQREDEKTGKNPIPVYIIRIREESCFMKQQKHQQKQTRSATGFFAALSILLALCLAAVLLLPSLVGYTVNRILKQSAAGGYIVCDVSQISLFSANASVHARQKMRNGRFRSVLSLPHGRITYTPLGLLRGRIEGITITGATIPATIENGTLSFPLLEIFKSVRNEEKEQTEQKPAASSAGIPDLGFIRIENGALNLRYGKKALYIPVSMTVRQEGGKWKKLFVQGRIHLNGQTIVIREAAIDMDQQTIRASVRLRDAVLNNLPHPLDLYANEAGLQGNLTASILLDLNYGKGMVHKLESRLRIQDFSAKAGGKTISSKNLTCNLDFDGRKGSLVLKSLNVSGLLSLERFTTGFELTGETLSGKSTLELKTPDPNRLDFVFSATGSREQKAAEVSIKTAEGKAYELSIGDFHGKLDSMVLNLKASPERQSALLKLNGIEIDGPGRKGSVREAALQVQHEKGKISGELSGTIARVEDAASAVAAEGIVFSVPFLRGERAEGTVSVDTIAWKGRPLARVNARTAVSLSETFEENRADLFGNVTLPKYPGIGIRFRSENRYDKGGFLSRNFVELPESEIPQIAFEKIGKELSGIRLTGRIQASGSYEIGTHSSGGGSFRVSLSGVTLEDPAHELSLEGGNLDFELPSLPALRSSPGLRATADRICFGGVDVQKFSLFYRMESPTVWAVEAIKANWAFGVVRMEFTRLDLTKKVCELVLHCDRLNLSEILRQLGQKAAASEGTLSGTLPLTISPGNIVFHDGFLDSTPGVTGTLKLSNTEYLTAGVPENIPQYAQLKFSQDVLKDFSYDWAKLNLSSRNDVLTLQMKISGRPSHPLPYRYNGGELVRINTLTTFAGVRLDINFNLPLANVLNIINNIKKLSGGSL